MAGGSRNDSSPEDSKGPRPSLARTLYRFLPWDLRKDLDAQEALIAELGRRLDERSEALERRFDEVEGRLDALEEAVRVVQGTLERVDTERLVEIDSRLDGAEKTLRTVGEEVARTRDRVIPAVVDRGNLLIDRLASELDEVASLVERSLLSEPLPAPSPGPREAELSAALARLQPLLVDALRGSEEEIRHRLDRHLPVLRDAGPVLDLGCGRGELLLMLREADVKAVGVERDPALVQAARRRGLELLEGDAASVLARQPDGSWGAVTAIHLFEHLQPPELLALLAEVTRVLRPGGLLLAECPNPLTLRVGATEYWADPTHTRPLLPQTLELYLAASGLRVDRLDFLHPFPEDQRLVPASLAAAGEGAESDRLSVLERRLDELLNGPRDFVVTASKPSE